MEHNFTCWCQNLKVENVVLCHSVGHESACFFFFLFLHKEIGCNYKSQGLQGLAYEFMLILLLLHTLKNGWLSVILSVQIKYSIMHPGTHVWPHTGPTNCRLRMHLGLVIPKEGCKIRCANETRYISFVIFLFHPSLNNWCSLWKVCVHGMCPFFVAEVDRNEVICIWTLVCDFCAF